MLRKVVGAVVVLVLFVGVTLADEIMAAISKVEGGKVTFTEMKGKEKVGEAKTMPVADKVKVVKGKFDKDTMKVTAGDDIEDGLKNKMFSEIGEKGVRAQIVTDKDNKTITEIRILGGGKKKDK
jgi:hypothetical protein